MRKNKLIVLLIILAFALTAGCGIEKNIRFGTAGKGGTYYNMVLSLTELMKEDNLKVDIRETAGAAANLRLLSSRYIELGLTQADILYDYWNAEGQQEGQEPLKGYRALAGLYTEACQIVVREDSDIQSIRDLEDKIVSMGEEDSGTAITAGRILEIYGLIDKLQEKKNLSLEEAAEALKNKDIDAFFFVAGVQTPLVEELAKDIKIRLLQIDESQAAVLQDNFDYYTRYTIPADCYTGQAQEVPTIGVRAVFVVSDELPEDTVFKITDSFFAHLDKLEGALPIDFTLEPESAVEDIPVPFHKGAAKYYQSKGISVESE